MNSTWNIVNADEATVEKLLDLTLLWPTLEHKKCELFKFHHFVFDWAIFFVIKLIWNAKEQQLFRI